MAVGGVGGRPGLTIPGLSSIPTGIKDDELVFNSLTMNKKTPTTPNRDTIQYNANVRLYSWRIEPSTDAGAKRVSLYFRMPDGYDGVTAPVVKLHFFIEAFGGVGANAQFRIRAGYRADGEIIPGAAGPFDETKFSPDVAIVEPAAGTLRHKLTTVTLTAALISAGEWILLVIDRDAPDVGTEYDKDLLLNVVSFKYRRA